MNRRTFLKSIAIACGAAVVCPGELVKKKRHPGIDKIPEYVMKDIPYGIPYYFQELAEPDGWVSIRGIRIPYQENLPE